MADEPLISGSLEDIDRVCDEFERRYRAGESPRIEELLGEVSATDNGALTLELIALEVWFRRSAEQNPSADEYTARFPQIEREILELFTSESSESISRGMTKRSFAASRSNLKSTVSWAAPTAVGRYRLISLLGHGGFGEVWKGIDTELQRSVAVKLMRADLGHTPELAELFVSEGRKLAQLRHPGVVTVFDVGQTEGRCYIVSELMDGGTLAARLKAAAFAPSDAALLIAKIADALHHAHLQGLIHRDIKPQNILLDASGEPKLADFGLAANEDDQLAEAPATMGTLAYMSPEVVRGASHHSDARADIYSLGVVLYQALTRRLPFVAHSAEQYREQILNREVRPPRTIDDRIPPELERICLKCLQKNLVDRYTTAADLASELRSAVIGAPPTGPAPGVWPASRLIPIGVLALLLSVGIALAPAVISYLTPGPVGGTGASKGPPELKWEPGQLPYDETAPGFEPVASEWQDLLKGPEPRKLDWSNKDSSALFLHNRARSELRLDCAGRGMVTLGRTATPGYVIQLDLYQNGWEGRFGVYFGYHQVEGEANPADGVQIQGNREELAVEQEVRYQTIKFEISPSVGNVLRRGLITESGWGTEKPEIKTKQLSQASIPQLTSKPMLLELEITRSRLKVLWGGKELEELSRISEPVVTPEDQVGEFGIFIYNANGIVRNARIMRRHSAD